MRLRTLESFWLLKNGLLYSYPSLEADLSTEIIVIGGGITGALISHSLLEAGYQVTLIDKRDIGQGSTAATTSMLQYEIDVPLYKLAELIGENEAAHCYRAGINAIKKIEELIHSQNIDCGFKTKKSLYFAHNVKASRWLKKEFDIRNKHQLGVQWLDKNEVWSRYGLITEGAILSGCAASIDAYKFTQELIHKNIKRGLRVYDQTVLKKIEYGENIKIVLENDCIATAKKIVFCSGFETTALFPEKTAALLSTFACVSECNIKIPEALNELLIWNTEDPYIYMRTTDDGRLLLGGEDSTYNSGPFREKIKDKKSARLIKKLKKLIPGIHFTEDFSWAGVFGSTKDGLLYIGAHPEFPNALFVLGYGGNGITFSVQGMYLIHKLLNNEPDDLLRYYRFNR